MKKRIGSIGFMLILFFHLHAQQAKDSTVHFWVNGLCDMCKDRIENAVKKKGVSAASWDDNTKEITISYDPSKIKLIHLHQWIANVGHDTKLRTATTTMYNSLPECCKYRDMDKATHDGEAESGHDDHAVDQPSIVKGVVLKETGKGAFVPLLGATVQWIESKETVLTDSNGVFKIPMLGVGKELVISYTGLKSDTLVITDAKDLKMVVVSGTMLKQVEVTARQRSLYSSSASIMRTQVISERELFKAACCNLSESFETNPSVEANYNDAITGTKQIQMLGLSGVYSQLTVESMPGPRGLATASGLGFIPGPWVESIQISKGVGSVVNGFESITGQINVELKKPEKAERLFANAYVNDMGKADFNLDLAHKISNKWSTALLLHHNFMNNTMADANKDGFRDIPTGYTSTFQNRWKFDNGKGWMAQFGVKGLWDEKTGGMTDFNPKTDQYSTHHYGFGINTVRWEGFSKLGYVFPEKKYKSIGLQVAYNYHNQGSYFGQTRYDAKQNGLYSNLIYQSIIGNTNHKFRTGLSASSDKFEETFRSTPYNRTENVAGAFFEYTYSYLNEFNVVAGIRADHHSIYGTFYTPRLHVRYEPVKGSVLRVATGAGRRTVNVFAENMGAMASSRTWLTNGLYPFQQEKAWNTGFTFDQSFQLFQRNASFSADYYYTQFKDQVVVDMENPTLLQFYQLRGKSYSHSAQVELSFEPLPKLEMRLAYRWVDVKTTYNSGLLEKPLVARDRAFANIAYEWKRWKIDATANRVGQKRIPYSSSPEATQERSQAYVIFNAQLTHAIGKKKTFDLYIGGENLSNYFQKNSVLSAADPFGPNFDASLVWGPVYGRMFYAGFRYKIK